MNRQERYKTQRAMHMRLARGGWCYVDEVLDGDKLIATRTTFRATRKDPVLIEYERNGVKYATVEALLDAYEAETT